MKNSYAFKLECYLIADWSLPVIALGLGIFLLFSQWNWYNYYVNMVAKSYAWCTFNSSVLAIS